MNDGKPDGVPEISTDDEASTAIADLDRACREGDTDKVDALVGSLYENLSVPPCGSSQRVVEASMAITRAIVQLGDVEGLASWTSTAPEALASNGLTVHTALSDDFRNLGTDYLNAGDAPRAELLFDAALRLRREIEAVGEAAVELAKSVADAGARAGNIDLGLDALRTELARIGNSDGPGIELKIDLLATLVGYLPQVGKAEEAISYCDELIAYRAERAPVDFNSFIGTLFTVVLAYVSAGRHDGAATVVRSKTVEVVQTLVDPRHHDPLLGLPATISSSLLQLQRPDDAEKLLLALIEQCNKELHVPTTHMMALHALADLYTRQGLKEKAEPILAELTRVQEKTAVLARSDPKIGANLVQQGLNLLQVQEFERAIESFEGAIRVFKETHGEASLRNLTAKMFLGSAQHHAGQRDKARDTLATCARSIDDCTPEDRLNAEINLVAAYAECADHANTEALAKRVLADAIRVGHPPSDALLAVTIQLADAMQAQDKLDITLDYRRTAVELTRALHGDTSQVLGYRLGDLALTLDALGKHEEAVDSYNRSFELIHGIELGP